MSKNKVDLYFALAFFILFSLSVYSKEPPKIALIIDDMGEQWILGQQALQLPGAITYSFLPFSSYAPVLADLAYKEGKELMLHIPMQAIDAHEHEVSELTEKMSTRTFEWLLNEQLKQIAHISGINNHKGSLLTQNYSAMKHLLQFIKNRYGDSLFFVDSKTTVRSIAEEVAKKLGVATLGRDVFLDHDAPEKEEIRQQFRKLILLAQQNGSALGIAHPRKNTLAVLKEELVKMKFYGVQLVPVSHLIVHKNQAQTVKQREINRKLSLESWSDNVSLDEYDIF